MEKLSGLRVVMTCSEVNRNLKFDLGADAVFDYYHDAEVGDQIRFGQIIATFNSVPNGEGWPRTCLRSVESFLISIR